MASSMTIQTITALLNDFGTGMLLARRARYLSTSIWLLLAMVVLAAMAAQFSGRQPATVTLDVGLSVVRLLLPLLVILLVQELVSREFDRRYFLTSLTYPRPRHAFLLGRIVAIMLLLLLTLIAMALVLTALTSYIASGYEQATPVDLGIPFWLTVSFIAADLFVVIAMATLVALAATTPGFVLIGTLGFVFISRSYATIVELLARNRFLYENTQVYQDSLSTLGYLLPDLAALDIRMITLYGKMELLPADWLSSLAGALVYGVGLLAVSLIVLYRKRFN